MKAKSFGLDISLNTIKALLLKKEGEQVSVDSIAASPSTPRGILSESILDQQELANAIKNLVETAKISTSHVVFSIPESQTYTKIIEMAQLQEKEAALAVHWEMERQIPLTLDQVRTDWRILENKEISGRKVMNVLIVAVPKTIIEKYEKIMELSGLIPEAIETEMISVIRSLSPMISTPSPSMIVHLGTSATNIAVAKNGTLNMTVSLNLGGIAITRALSLDLGIDIKQAEDFKRSHGIGSEGFEEKIGKVLQPILQSIVGDLKKVMFSYKERNNEEVKQIILSGGEALLPGIEVFFADTLGVQVGYGNGFICNSIGNVPPQILADSASFNTVVGLALRDLV